MSQRAIRTITFSSLYPNGTSPNHGIFVENRLRHLLDSGEASTRVVAPVPLFPFRAKIFGRYARLAEVPRVEERNGIQVHHPRYPVVPKIGMTIAPASLFMACLPLLRRLRRRRDFDLIDAHYFYPDGVAATMLGKIMKKPVVITARGTDINLIPSHPMARRQIQWAARDAEGIVAVSEALKDALVALGVRPERVSVLRNGVDLTTFRPENREQARHAFGLANPTLLSVGQLIERKANDLIVGALPSLPEFTLILAGDGPERRPLENLAARLGVSDRVRFLGAVPHSQLSKVYSAADILVLASSREGWPNVLLEAMACGTPVIASNVWGNPEVVTSPEAGRLMDERTSARIAQTVRMLFTRLPD
ncbi:MAG TPA: glycosyltransferase family 4 protein, partial [Tepidisphaeraceae bacterium]|nr:glycosyltransferase family 4 protein [Tepidisphaeraceae bacterium]